MYAAADRMGRYSDMYNRYVITTLNDRPIQPLVKELVTNLSGLLRISVDAYYTTKSTATVHNPETGENEVQTKTGIIYPNVWGSINTTEFVRNTDDLNELLLELDDQAFADGIVANTFKRRKAFLQSNVRLHRILAFQIVIRQYPAAWLFK